MQSAFTELLANLFLPHLLEIVGAALALLIGYAATAFTRWTGIQIEEQHRRALHSALMTGIRAALSRGMNPEQAVDHAKAYAETSVPDALGRLKPAPAVLQSLARAKLQEATAAGDR